MIALPLRRHFDKGLCDRARQRDHYRDLWDHDVFDNRMILARGAKRSVEAQAASVLRRPVVTRKACSAEIRKSTTRQAQRVLVPTAPGSLHARGNEGRVLDRCLGTFGEFFFPRCHAYQSQRDETRRTP
jgi:hypothetical protein